jgi:hypothetical protein
MTLALLAPVAPDVADRFWVKVDKIGTCWLWTAARNGIVPLFAIGGAPCDARRVAWEFSGRGSLEGLTLRPHASVNRCSSLCVRPEHHDTVPSRQPDRSRGILNLMAERASRRDPAHTIATQPGGPLGARYTPPNDLAADPKPAAAPIDRAMARAADRSERDCAAPQRTPWSLVIEEAGLSVRLYERAPGSVLYREVRIGGRKDRASFGHRDRALAEQQARQEARTLAAEVASSRTTHAAVVGPFASGGFVAITPWGSFNGNTMLAVCASAEAERPPIPRS